MTCSESILSRSSSGLSSKIKITSKRDNSAGPIFKFSLTVFDRLHLKLQ